MTHGSRSRTALAAVPLVVLLAGAAPAQSPGPPASPETRLHRVQPGETVWRLAVRYGSSVEAIMELNGVRDVRFLAAGRTITIPVARTAAPASLPHADPLGPAFDQLLARAEQALGDARFDDALARASEARTLAPRQRGVRWRQRTARLEVVVATAHLAYGRRRAAVEHLGRALADDPQLALPDATSPKLQSALQAARILAER